MSQAQSIQKTSKNHRVKRPTQTGFSSPATHYSEPRIDLNDALVQNASATFFIRAGDASFLEFNIHKDDVLIIDKSLEPDKNQLVVVIQDDTFKIMRMDGSVKSEFQLWGVITYVIKSVL